MVIRGAAVALTGWLLAGSSCAGVDTREDDLNSLVDAERAFASSAAQLGTRDAFIAHLADDAVLFRPRAVNAQEILGGQPATPGLLSWEPVFADISEAGDLGFTTGPWDYRSDSADEPLAHGQYFSFWKRQQDGNWKVVIDHGTENPAPSEERGGLQRAERRTYRNRWVVRYWERDDVVAKLLEIDRAFSSASEATGLLAALTSYASGNVRTLRNGMQPVSGAESLRALASDRVGTLTWRPLGGEVSMSGDLAYTYGEYEYIEPGSEAPDEVGVYVRAWRRISDESWRVTVDLQTPIEAVEPS